VSLVDESRGFALDRKPPDYGEGAANRNAEPTKQREPLDE